MGLAVSRNNLGFDTRHDPKKGAGPWINPRLRRPFRSCSSKRRAYWTGADAGIITEEQAPSVSGCSRLRLMF